MKSSFDPRVLLAATGVAVALGASPAMGQSDPVFAHGLRFWAWNDVLGTGAQGDPRIKKMIRVDLNAEGTPNNSAAAKAVELANEVGTRGFGNGEIALFINHFGHGNQYRRSLTVASTEPWPSNVVRFQNTTSTNAKIVALYAHPDDAYVSSNPIFNGLPTPWMSHGIAECKAWTLDFIAEYQTRQDINPFPSDINRVHQDQEVEAGELYADNTYNHDFRWIDYWHQLKTDARWNARDPVTGDVMPDAVVPGFPDKTLSELWSASGLSDNTTTIPQLRLQYTDEFRTWFRWFIGVKRQAEAAALEEALYAPMRTAFGAKCSDYDQSVRLDGAAQTDGRTNTFIGGGFQDNHGLGAHWDGFGDIQALQMYSYSSSYGIARSTTVQPGHEATPWWDGRMLELTKDDGVIYGADFTPANPEWILDAALRQNRWTLDSCIRSNSGSNANKLMSYITMPGERDHLGGPAAGLYSPNTDLRDWGRAYYWVSNDAIRRLLMLSRSRGINEYVVWSYNHSNTEYTWDRLRSMVDQVWGFTATGVWPSIGTASGNVADLNIAPDNLVTVTVPAANTSFFVDVGFTNTYGDLDKGVRLNLELTSNADVYVRADIAIDETTFLPIDLDPRSTNDFVKVSANQAGRITGITGPVLSISGADPAYVRLTFTDAEGEVIPLVSRIVKLDLVQIAADDDVHRCLWDFDVDGWLTINDYDIFMGAYTASCHDPIADLNRDGFIDFTDSDIFTSAFYSSLPAADINYDGFVDFTDFDLFAEAFDDPAAAACTVNSDLFVDVNGDGRVDSRDLEMFLSLFSTGDCVVGLNE